MRVFLTSDSKAGRSALRQILEGHGHLVEEPSDFGAGALLASTDAHADAVIAVVLAGRPPLQRRAAVLVEVGIAVGRSIPTLIISRPGLQLPSLAGVPRMEADLEDLATLDLKVDLFLEGVRDGAPSKPPKSAQSGIAPVARAAMAQHTGLELEEMVGRLLLAAGSNLIENERSPRSDGPDYALYLQGHETDVGMVLVEVKAVRQSAEPRRRLREAAVELSSQVLTARAALGLLVYDGPSVTDSSTPLVVAMSVDDLTAQLENAALPVILRKARNRAIHGM